jgi:hypothetical protein
MALAAGNRAFFGPSDTQNLAEGFSMRGVLLVAVQLIISLLVVGAVLPGVLYGVTAARSPRVGITLAATIVLAIFLVLRMAWSRPRQS